MSHTDESNDLLREIRDLLVQREEQYQKYLEDIRKEYDAYLQKNKMSSQHVGALTLWAFIVLFAANFAAGLFLKAGALFDFTQVGGL